ncbi:GNAT family N-acetyltransferase [Pseudalkalibacillus caeni]|uniref:GNAT family N-acetyltransferase n=1 Tax=Exobacillus caeni TaxID=2574798 RepID=A0A5R9F718_9BACL|nr:GNAT family N-acetyltransferase [Pseudalkalibacillus caeni]TLS38309.1 GNAT family N-acetyltransferase [Pseudalkalibacillus caeni]
MLIRKATSEDYPGIATVHINSWKTTYQGIVASAYLDNLDLEERKQRWQRILAGSHNVYLAESIAGKVVGFAALGDNRSKEYPYSAELHAIYILKDFQGSGIGRGLFDQAAAHFNSKKQESMIVWVLAENTPARSFYERLGGRVVGEKTLEIGGQPHVEAAYGWEKLSLAK